MILLRDEIINAMHIIQSLIYCWHLINDFIENYLVLQPRQSQLHLADIVRCAEGNSFA